MGKRPRHGPGTGAPKSGPGQAGPETEPEDPVMRTFKRTYIGDHGIFLAGESRPLTREQREALADDLE